MLRRRDTRDAEAILGGFSKAANFFPILWSRLRAQKEFPAAAAAGQLQEQEVPSGTVVCTGHNTPLAACDHIKE